MMHSEEIIDSLLDQVANLKAERDALLAQRQPLTVAEVEQILAQHDYAIHGDRARYIVRMTEKAHGIGGAT